MLTHNSLLTRFHRRIASLALRLGFFWPLVAGATVIVLITGLAILGYMTLENWSFFDSLYMVIITLTTVGYQEVHPLSQAGRLMTMGVIISGVGTFFYLAGVFIQALVEGRLQMFLGRRRMQRSIDRLSDHMIVCGYGRIGSVVVNLIRREGQPLVVVEKDPAVLERLAQEGILHVTGDATSDEVLLGAGLLRAKSLVAALTQEAANVYVTLTARQLNPKLYIVARSDSEQHIPRLERAGADRVVLPHLIGGMRMAESVLRPTVTNLLELASRGDIDLRMEEYTVGAGSEFIGKNLATSQIRQRFNVIIIAIKKADATTVFNPGPDEAIGEGDTLITVGKPGSLSQLQAVCDTEVFCVFGERDDKRR